MPVEPLVAAIYQRAVRPRESPPEALFSGPTGRAWAAARRALNRRGAAAVTRVDDAVKLAEAAGVDPDEVWGADTVSVAVGALTRPEPVRDAQGQIVIGPDGTPEMALVPQRVRVGVAGYDIGITVPKSMSVLLAFAPDEITERVEQTTATRSTARSTGPNHAPATSNAANTATAKPRGKKESRGFSGWVMVHRAARPVGDAPWGPALARAHHHRQPRPSRARRQMADRRRRWTRADAPRRSDRRRSPKRTSGPPCTASWVSRSPRVTAPVCGKSSTSRPPPWSCSPSAPARSPRY